MTNEQNFVDFVCDQAAADCELSYRHMFGGTTLYSKGKVVGLITDNRLFIKPTEAGRRYIGDVNEAPAYEGSRKFFLIGDQLDDSEWLSELLRVTEHELPKPRPRKRNSAK